MRGRLPSGPEFVDHLPVDKTTRERGKAVLETMTGTLRVHEACKRLGISEPRFDQLRIELMLTGLKGIQPRRAGRPRRTATPEQKRIRELEAKLAEAELKLRIAQAREEIALALPSLVREPGNDHIADSASDQEKKTRRRQRRARARLPASRNT